MVNKIKRFFRSIGKPSGGSASLSGAYPVLASSDNQFHHLHEQQQYRSGGNNGRSLASSPLDSAGGMPVMMLRSAAEGSGSGSDSTGSSHRNGGGDGIRWSLLLPRIPRLVAEATAVSTSAASGSSSPVDDNVEMTMLLEMLTQMAPKEAQAQIRQFYIGDSSGAPASATIAASSSTPAAMIAGWEQRKVFRQCRRALLLCWKFIVAQLNDENAHITSELKETYFQLIGLIAERVEFNLSGDASSSSSAAASSSSSAAASGNASKNAPSRQHATSGHMMGWTVNSPTASAAPTPLASSIDLTSDTNSAGSSGASSSDEGVDGERDLYLYRCLLVATFKYVVENIEGAKASKRSWITLAELRFFAKVLAICFFRIPVLQRMIIDQIYFAYRQKRWISTTTAATPSSDDNSSGGGSSRPTPPAASDSRVHRRRSSSRLGSGVTFTGSLSRWSEFEGHVLSESSGDGDDSSARDDMAAAESNQNVTAAAAAAAPSRATVDKFKRLNPTLFRWSRYAPYLAPYADSDVFRMNDAMKFSWLEKLSHDGEFFAVFMGYYTHHADVCAIGEPVWSCLPGYTLLIRVTLLLLKEACWNKWLFIRDNTVHSSPSALYDSPSAARDDREPFELRSIRGIRAVLDSVVHWLRNKELLESCTLALLECTNVLHSRCVTFCLTRSEAWFSAAATLVTGEGGQLVHRLPPSFSGQTFAIGVRHMLSSESFETLTQTLQFLYNRMDYFDGELRQSILKVLVQRHMFLFLHWHAEVRSCYHHVLVYKIIRVNRYFLDSPIDHLLIGRHAVLQLENSISIANGFDDFDDHLGGGAPYANVKSGGSSDSSGGGQQFHITAAEFSALRTEQALWRAFDACIGAICVHERRNAKEGNRRYQSELQCARSRAIAFQRLNRTPVDDLAPTSSMNEGLPGGKSWFELELLEEELHREPPYYLRYLPAEEVSSIDELRRLASTLRYPPELQVYAAASLRHYSSLLKKYYEELSRNRFVEAPPLGFE